MNPQDFQYDQTSLELCKECGWRAMIPGEGCLTCARQNAKPVAYLVEYLNGEKEVRFQPNGWGDKVTPLYTAPRQWVGLTEEEMQTLYDRYAVYQEYGAEDSGWFDFARAIEAWLREKNT